MDRDQRLIEFCQQAVRIPSPSGQEREVAQLMKRKMEEYGFDEVLIDRYGSVLGRMRGRRPGKTILLDGHIDRRRRVDPRPLWRRNRPGADLRPGHIGYEGKRDGHDLCGCPLCRGQRPRLCRRDLRVLHRS